ncbi:MAG: Rpn family recombination-promoting nuclease/putative transposase [Alphaproteobacteria bacterium]|nr:Rpn family recombination-promoting nuclease/putative transposase [Alphaproteobacteria bacterium]
MAEKIDPRVDIAFKKIFGVEENKDLLISLINSIVSKEDQVKSVTLLNPYNLKSFKKDKLSILDVKAEGEDGKRFNIEIQISDEADYDKRALYYWAKLYTDQLKSGKHYGTLSKAIGIHILNFTSILGVPAYHNVFHIQEQKTGLHYFKNLELHTIELHKFVESAGKQELKDFVGKVKNALDIWSTFLSRHDLLKKDKLPSKFDNPALKKALNVLEIMNFTDDERMAYDDRLKWLMIEANTLEKYEEKGFERGFEKGREEKEEALKKAEEKAQQEKEVALKNEKIEIAKALLLQGVDTETIVKATKIPKQEVEKLRSQD